jgi:hypothetical protein
MILYNVHINTGTYQIYNSCIVSKTPDLNVNALSRTLHNCNILLLFPDDIINLFKVGNDACFMKDFLSSEYKGQHNKKWYSDNVINIKIIIGKHNPCILALMNSYI